ncbi:MAG: SDR family NAD(P)-dependent oxidoreductase [Chitinophagales bacterium]|nr:SDR family NAD(P)-dependent oxidoreductase [Chitinophagales bacterium]HMV14552.1 SDR family NAD(P)-dependent oxidoreductase [Chitinophagales bacterium]HMW11622.1 SDR family NAD(P)-dependent oxidoreductase [Chitinophagales bacterium]HMX60758.1 SDR family NAD(P)-dependent oxidoreductase [Chitinophagales bacterium]HMY23283.1 SDR family NAD(P)-dependent oxidoreductase [Chitinophagales bacterium]
MSKVIVIIGAGQGIGKAVATQFGKQGFSIALIARKSEKLEILKQQLIAEGIDAHAFTGDAGDPESMREAFNQIWEIWEHIDTIHYNVAKIKNVNIAIETADGLTRDFKINVASVMTALHLVLPDMEKKEKGTILLTGGGFALEPNPDYGSLAIGKAGIRNLAASLHQALKSKNIFVGTVTVCGLVSPNAEKHTPANIATQFWKLYTERNEFEIQF